MTREDAVKHFADFVVDDFYAASPGDRTKDNLRECIKDALQKIAEWEREQSNAERQASREAQYPTCTCDMYRGDGVREHYEWCPIFGKDGAEAQKG